MSNPEIEHISLGPHVYRGGSFPYKQNMKLCFFSCVTHLTLLSPSHQSIIVSSPRAAADGSAVIGSVLYLVGPARRVWVGRAPERPPRAPSAGVQAAPTWAVLWRPNRAGPGGAALHRGGWRLFTMPTWQRRAGRGGPRTAQIWRPLAPWCISVSPSSGWLGTELVPYMSMLEWWRVHSDRARHIPRRRRRSSHRPAPSHRVITAASSRRFGRRRGSRSGVDFAPPSVSRETTDNSAILHLRTRPDHRAAAVCV